MATRNRARKRFSKQGLRKLAAEVMRQNRVEPDARAKFALLQEKRAENPDFRNVINENGEWV